MVSADMTAEPRSSRFRTRQWFAASTSARLSFVVVMLRRLLVMFLRYGNMPMTNGTGDRGHDPHLSFFHEMSMRPAIADRTLNCCYSEIFDAAREVVDKSAG